MDPGGAGVLPGHAPLPALPSLPATTLAGKNEIRMSPPRNEPFSSPHLIVPEVFLLFSPPRPLSPAHKSPSFVDLYFVN